MDVVLTGRFLEAREPHIRPAGPVQEFREGAEQGAALHLGVKREHVEPRPERGDQRAGEVSDPPEQLVQRGHRRRHLDRLQRAALHRGPERRGPAHVARVAEAQLLLDQERRRRRPPAGRRARVRPDPDDRLERLRRAAELGADRGRGQAVHPILPADVVPAVGRDVVPFVRDPAEQRREAGADRARRQERAREQRAHAVEPQRVRPPHLREEARPERAPDRQAGAIRPHRDEERGARAGPAEQIQQPRHALLEAAPRVDVHAQGYCRLNHSIVRRKPSSSGTSALAPSSSRMRPTAGTRRGISS